MPANSAVSDYKRSVSPRGSVLQQNVTKLAATATRSIAVQTKDPAWGGISLWGWLTPTAVTSTATQTSDPAADGRSVYQRRSIQGNGWLELQKVSHAGADEGAHSQHLSGHAYSEQELRRGVGAFLPGAGAEGEACQTGLQRHYRGDDLLD